MAENSNDRDQTERPAARTFWTAFLIAILLIPLPFAFFFSLADGITGGDSGNPVTNFAINYLVWFLIDAIPLTIYAVKIRRAGE